MVIFAAIAMVILVVAGFALLFSTDWAQDEASDRELYGFLAAIGIGTPLVWTLLNLPLLAARGQTGGQYVAGLRLTRADGRRLSVGDVAVWWFCFNPLLFSWPMALVAGLPLAAVIALILSRVTVFVFGALIALCLLAPIAAFVSALLDGQNRALHDRVAGTVVAPAD